MYNISFRMCESLFFLNIYLRVYSTHAIKLPIKQQQHILRLSLFWFLFFFNSMMQEFTPRGNNCVGFFSCLCVHGRLSLAICHISLIFFFFFFSWRAMNQPVFIPLCFRESHVIKELVSCVFLTLFVIFLYFSFFAQERKEKPTNV